MTKRGTGEQRGAEEPRCAWCGRRLPEAARTGRPRRYCRAGCRQQAYTARRWAGAHGLDDDDLIVSRATVDDLLGKLYCLQAAVEDVRRDLDGLGRPRVADLTEALDWLLENADPLTDAWLEPRALDST